MRIRPITLTLPTVFALLLSLLAGSVDASYSYSAYQCPMPYGGYGGYGGGGYGGGGGGYGGGGYGGGGYPGYGGRMCGAPSIFHYYTCCDYNPTDCCVVLETWVIVMLVLIGILSLACCLACCGACVWGYQRSRGGD